MDQAHRTDGVGSRLQTPGLRIWVVNHYADPPEGMATRTFDIARRWAETGHEVTVFLSNFSHYRLAPMRRLRPLSLWTTERLDGVNLVWIRTAHYQHNNWRRAANMLSFAAVVVIAGVSRRPKPSVVIGVSVHPLAALSGWVIAAARRARFLVEITDLWPQTLIDLGRLRESSLSARAMRAVERFLYKRAERIVMLWRNTDEYVSSLGVSPDKILWVPHGVELERYEDLLPYDGAPTRPFRVMYMGGFVYSMAFDNLLAAARILQQRGRTDIRFYLVGAGTEREQVQREAHELGLTNVDFPSAVPKARIAERMSEADAFILGVRDVALYKYGQSLNKLMDYLAGGRPILYYGRSSYNPVELAGAGITCPPEDPAALADAVEQLADLSPDERMAMGRRGREYLIEHHTIPVLADRMLNALASQTSADGGVTAKRAAS